MLFEGEVSAEFTPKAVNAYVAMRPTSLPCSPNELGPQF
jgi:hypothetical protein